MHSILVFINDSLGELDWIQPFVLEASSEYKISVYLYLPGKTVCQKKRIFEDYFGLSNDIVYLNEGGELPSIFTFSDRLMNSCVRRLGVKSQYMASKLVRVFNFLRGLGADFFVTFNKTEFSYDLVFRDYNLKDSFGLNILSRMNLISPKIVIYPHSTAILSNTADTPKRAPRNVRHDLFLENTPLSTKFLPDFADTYTVVGSPSLDLMRDSPIPTDFKARSVLFVTRNCDPDFFGFTQADALRVFEGFLLWAENEGIKVFCKHHPRDSRLSDWRNVQNRYANAAEVLSTLNDFREPIDGVLSFYTSVGILFTCQGIPVFDVSPYKGPTNRLPFHYRDSHNEITHELIEYGLYARPKSIAKFDYLIDEQFLRTIGDAQKAATDEIFPSNACESISAAIGYLLATDTEPSQ